MTTKTTKSYCLMNYTVQCLDQVSGKIGSFIYDQEKYKETGKFYCVGQFHPDLHSLFQSDDYKNLKGKYIERSF